MLVRTSVTNVTSNHCTTWPKVHIHFRIRNEGNYVEISV